VTNPRGFLIENGIIMASRKELLLTMPANLQRKTSVHTNSIMRAAVCVMDGGVEMKCGVCDHTVEQL